LTRTEPKIDSKVCEETVFVEMYDEQNQADDWEEVHDPIINQPVLEALHKPRKYQ